MNQTPALSLHLEDTKRPASEAWKILRDEDGTPREDSLKGFNPYEFERMGKKFSIGSNSKREFHDPFDLNNLLCIPPKEVETFLEKLEDAAAKNPDKYIAAIVGTGGTIGMKMVDGVLKPRLDPQTILNEAGAAVRESFVGVGMEYIQMDSSQLDIPYVADLAIITSWIMKNASATLRDRLVVMVTHGTDTLAESQSLYSTMMGPNIPVPVGFVGAQSTIYDDGSDVGSNVANTLSTLRRMVKQRKPWSFLYMGGTGGGAMEGVVSAKLSDTKVAGFEPQYGRFLDDYSRYGVHTLGLEFRDRYFAALTVNTNFRPLIWDDYTRVQELSTKPGQQPEALKRTIETMREFYDTVLFQVYGGGTSHDRQREAAVSTADSLGMSFIGTNRIPMADPSHLYEAAKQMREDPRIIVAGSKPFTTETKANLMNVLYPGNRAKMRHMITQRNIVGEQPSDDTLRLLDLIDGPIELGFPNEVYHRTAVDLSQAS